MEKYEASNGATVERFSESLNVKMRNETWLEPWAVMALSEFFRAKRDEELGRWRWPDNPDYVVYPDENGAGVLVWNERTRSWGSYSRGLCESTSAPLDGGVHSAAHAYFETHPEQKPWHDAKTCEVWVLTYCGAESAWTVNNDEVFENPDSVIELDDVNISAARRIWPEDES